MTQELEIDDAILLELLEKREVARRALEACKQRTVPPENLREVAQVQLAIIKAKRHYDEINNKIINILHAF